VLAPVTIDPSGDIELSTAALIANAASHQQTSTATVAVKGARAPFAGGMDFALGNQDVTTDDMEIVSALKLALADKVGQERFELWFGPTTRLDYRNGAVTVFVANQFHQDWLRSNFRHEIEWSCQATLGKPVPVQFYIDQELAKFQAAAKPACNPASPPSAANAPMSTTSASSYEPRRRLATLDSFVVGDSNRLAWSAAKTIASRLGQQSPLVLYGPTSIGKTHLLEGICQEVRRSHGGVQAVYLPAEQFTTMFLEALHGGGLPVFRRKYRSLDLLIVDDIQFLARKKATLTELLHMIDVFHRDGRQLVFAADRPPSDLGELGPEFITRLQSGLACPINPPEYETLLGIVRRLAERMSLVLPAEVEEFLAGKVATHARELSGALNRLDATSHALGEPISMAMAEQALADTVRRHARSVGLSDIDDVVCELFGLQPQSLQSDAKSKQVSHPRMLAMWLARRYTRAALSEIGTFFGNRAHSTVISAEKKVHEWMSLKTALQTAQGQCTIDQAIRKVEQRLRVG
jgi:chromosomal replication initiator protein